MTIFRNSGIQLRLLVAALIMVTGVAFALQLAGLQITKEFMQKRFADRISFLAKYLALNAEVGVLINDREGLKSLALNLLGEEDVGRVTICDNQNSVLVDIERQVPSPISYVETPVFFKKAGGENMLFATPKHNPFRRSSQENIQTIGKVKIVYSTHGINVLMIEIMIKFFFLSGVLALVGGGVFFFISRPMVREVRNLADSAEKVGKGDLNYRAELGSLPETRKLSSAFNEMLDSLEQNRLRLDEANTRMARHQALAEVGKFSLMIAHELKNPLGIIKSSFDMLRKDFHIPKDNSFSWYIEDEIRHVNSLVEDFLAFSRPTHSAFKKIDLNGMLSDICTRFKVMYNDSPDIIFRLPEISETPFYADADEALLTRSVSNLLKNAFESVGDSGMVIVKVATTQKGDWQVDVMDTGQGIPLEDLERIFEPFYTTKSKGSGLGLAFVKQAVTAHGGEISAVNRPESGSKFSLIIPGIKE
ncbi:HAMP domain-containing sensor histidine kinase [uncultured Desulfobacter sp.]|uniref:HAMP domain-containing sensor histidine kinase n=1 Tax=uncultured Desulfobacter sp. TaxID=240139 RepID=UPI002AABE7EF|nr:HAMP domain-containing sensor histidine kinase [uncultured Desulfobacter sp.]